MLFLAVHSLHLFFYNELMILITGGTGLLGSHIAVRLLAEGRSVRVMYRHEARKENLIRLINYYYPENASHYLEKLSWFKGDVLDLMDVEDAMKGVDEVIHCAALVSFFRRDFNDLFEVNRQGTANVVNFALAQGVKRFVHISSTAAVGKDSKDQTTVKRETNGWNPNDRVSGYSLSKYSAEKEVWRGVEEGLPAVIVNPSVMFGPGRWDESSLQIFRTLKNGLKFFTEGSNAFVDVRDVTEVVNRLLNSEIIGERFLVTGHNLAFLDMFRVVCGELKVPVPKYKVGPFLSGIAWRISGILGRLTGKRPTITKESAASAQSHSVFSTDKIQKTFPDFQFTPFIDTVRETIKGRQD